VLVCPSGVDVSTSTLRYLSACVRTRRRATGTQRPDALYADRGYDHGKYRKRGRSHLHAGLGSQPSGVHGLGEGLIVAFVLVGVGGGKLGDGPVEHVALA